MKKVLFLGGAPTQIPPIKYALEQGHQVITLDYLPDNPGHKLSHKYYNVSTTDKEAVLEVAATEEIDGIVAYASDPAAPTAAYVAEKMGLPGNPYESVNVLARKDLFRQFLADNGFRTPRSASFYTLNEASEWLDLIGTPAFVKPIDSSGSKGVTQIKTKKELQHAFELALKFSRKKKVVVEEMIVRKGYQVDSDVFMSNGELVFWAWGNQHQDKECHPYAPVAISFPSVLPEDVQKKARKEIYDILVKLDFKQGAFNVEFVVDENDDIWVIEIGPRNGGNLIPQVLKYATGVDMIAATVDAALDIPLQKDMQKSVEGFWSSVIIHSRNNGKFKELQLSDSAKDCIVECDMQVKVGESVNIFSGSHDTLGTMVMRYRDKDQMLGLLDNMEKDILVITD